MWSQAVPVNDRIRRTAPYGTTIPAGRGRCHRILMTGIMPDR